MAQDEAPARHSLRNDMSGPLHRFFAADHRRLDALLTRSLADPDRIDLQPFGEFRAGILKHIGMEEKILFPVARRAGATQAALTARLRVDHGAIASLLVPTPTPALVADMLSILRPHNRREEETGGIYGASDEALGADEAERLLQQLRAFPDVPLKPYNDRPEVFDHIRTTVELARQQWRGEP